MADVHAFGAYLARAMDAAGLTIADLKRLTGLSDSLISKWRNGQNVPSIPNLRLLAPALRMRLRDLVVAAGHMTPEEAGLVGIPEPPEPVPPSAEDAIRAEPYLSDDKKAAFIVLLNAAREENPGNEPESKRKRV